jgi:transcriptional regulator with XRE-family HTH domain
MDRHGFARRLAHALDLNGVGRADIDRKRYLASLMNISERHAGNYLRGDKLPTTEGTIDLAKKLGVSVEWLANGTLPIKPLPLTQDQIRILERLTPDQLARLFQIGGILAPQGTDDPPIPFVA